MTFQLSEPKLEGLAIRVQDLEAMIAFYQKLPGFYKLTEENNLAYFGGAKEGDAFLILEDTPFGAQEAGGVKKLARFSLSVPDLTQLKYVKNHLSKQGVKILQEEWSVGQGAFTIADPEENYLTFFVDHRLPADDLHPAAVQFQLQQIHLNVADEKASQTFFEHLGLVAKAEEEKFFQLDKREWIGFHQYPVQWHCGKNRDLEVLGLDFLNFSLPSQEELVKLSEHLQQLKIDFYRDKKLSILTIFDPNGVEWWFTSRHHEGTRV